MKKETATATATLRAALRLARKAIETLDEAERSLACKVIPGITTAEALPMLDDIEHVAYTGGWDAVHQQIAAKPALRTALLFGTAAISAHNLGGIAEALRAANLPNEFEAILRDVSMYKNVLITTADE